MSSYSPASGQHAIDQAVVGIRIFAPVSDDRFKVVVSKAGELAKQHNLPGRLQLDPMSLVFGRQVIGHGLAPPIDVTPGMLFQRVNEDGTMAEELTIERNAVTYRTRSYRRWSDVVEILKGIICPVASELAEDQATKLSVVELRCIDRFVADPGSRPPLSSLIRADTPYVIPGLLNHETQLHVHSGWFEDVTNDERTLINLNVDIVDNDTARSATILQAISWQGARDGVFPSSESFDSSVLAKFDTLHGRDKNLLGRLLTDDMQYAVKLFGAGGAA